ncbi:hypothetical protein AURDEDRAFT_184249 [Auricularia subglabra TFB-10046 SS5]|nr:hypothetical protein AURDEDRAFT_184249 [Auricularia subglabra TFB-10046 SS5]
MQVLRRLGLAASLATALALATPFTVPAESAQWTITPRYMRALAVFHGVDCLAGSDGLVMDPGVRAELLFNGTQLRLVGIAPPPGTQILMDGAPLLDMPFLSSAACVPFAEWPQLAPTPHNLTIIAPPSAVKGQFLIANATGTALETASSTSASSTPLPAPSSAEAQSDSSSTGSTQPHSPHPGLLIAAVLGPIVFFLCIGFGIYYYTRSRRRQDSPAGVTRSRSFKGMAETQFVMVTATARPETPGVVKV